MEEAQYLLLADRALEDAATWLEDFDPDVVDFSTSDGVITIDFPDGKRYVLNRQRGSHQMWLAAGARAWHYSWDAASSTWLDDKDGHELFENLRRVVEERVAG